jgi:hypothetical protein
MNSEDRAYRKEWLEADLKQYLEVSLMAFLNDPAEDEFRRGRLSALWEVYASFFDPGARLPQLEPLESQAIRRG